MFLKYNTESMNHKRKKGLSVGTNTAVALLSAGVLLCDRLLYGGSRACHPWRCQLSAATAAAATEFKKKEKR